MSYKIEIESIQTVTYSNFRPQKDTIKFKGQGVNTGIVNCIRSTCMNYVPVYSFCRERIKIKTNTSIFDNNVMTLRISQFPLFNIPTEIDILEKKYWHNINYTDDKRQRHPNDKTNLVMYISKKNTGNEILNVTTKDANVVMNDINVGDIYGFMHPLLVIKLKPGEEFEAVCEAVLGVGERNSIWSSVSNAYTNKISNTLVELIIENPVFSSRQLINKACKICIHKLDSLVEFIQDKKIETNEPVKIEVGKEYKGIGNIINTILQRQENVKFCGAAKVSDVDKKFRMSFIAHKDPVIEFKKACQTVKSMFDSLSETNSH